MRPRFEPEQDPGEREPLLVDPEEYDASEERFAASLHGESLSEPARFVSEPETNLPAARSAIEENLPGPASSSAQAQPGESLSEPLLVPGNDESSSDMQAPAPSWRDEVAARVSHYRSRRKPRAPRYPSLQLKFEADQPAWSERQSAPEMPSVPAISRESVAFANAEPLPVPSARVESVVPLPHIESADNVIEFPRSSTMPPVHMEELAEPVPDRLRIIEAPEVAPPPPALGGILIDPMEEAEQEKRPGFEMPLQSSSMPRRIAAAAADGVLIMAALAVFGYIVFRVAHPSLAWRPMLITGAALSGIFWAVYQYAFLVYTAATPGLRLAKLYPASFDGSYATRRLRRLRSLAAVLSGLSLMLGYLWCFLDEDHLCWHDRITRTHLAPRR